MRNNMDDYRAVMANVLQRLKKDDYRGLRLFQPWVEANQPSSTHAQLARELLDYAARELEPAQFAALRRWLEGVTFDELAGELGLSGPRDAERIVRAALARLRRQFGDRADG
jgi:hypothetical protein